MPPGQVPPGLPPSGDPRSVSWSPQDHALMATALRLAERGLGRVAPNPSVGCVLARDGRVVGRGWTQPGGRPHGETEALLRAGAAAKGATAYVNLEPCAHWGKTPPCTEALIKAGIARAVVSCEDPDPRVSGRGLQQLRDAGISVEVGLMAEEACSLNEGFFLRISRQRPLVTLKLATTLDGRIATQRGESKWITGEAARARAHLLRADHDAVLVGAGTAGVDDPQLDVRLPGLTSCNPLRVLLDGRLRTPLTHKMIAGADRQPTWLFTRDDNPKDRLTALREAGVEVLTVGLDAAERLDVTEVLAVLAERGITRLLVEGGGQVAAGFLRADLVDRLAWFQAGRLIGGDGLPAVAGFGLDRLVEAPAFDFEGFERLGPDLLECWRRAS
ncbi:bifunctional diaminohydroxyphosphoribosylaminopyrimidine deaminase/5-amino-6-(5-phosphoribosylamino)uracil reductase RibD [Algihabitans albus]|uniref:bifunctional diaminohydroxyphosphoribosylaminopyrimidine deaminase/5-amino-6-(5-phosphoribosylamino)uracil reductase RibD n=1 Tax=Algihabitans albus TaxID=2164067 RepID=UPI0022871B53|nr:bifunctional diaminohydroxyphosphoribosylaminopyrimidine deaminase/5-amino-6-(5-phosphoribosylamino)uracil reductase RibD [Algihabitans albus]